MLLYVLQVPMWIFSTGGDHMYKMNTFLMHILIHFGKCAN